MMQKKDAVAAPVLSEQRQKQVQLEQRQKIEGERQKLVLQSVKLPNGATFTRLKPVGMSQESRS